MRNAIDKRPTECFFKYLYKILKINHCRCETEVNIQESSKFINKKYKLNNIYPKKKVIYYKFQKQLKNQSW